MLVPLLDLASNVLMTRSKIMSRELGDRSPTNVMTPPTWDIIVPKKVVKNLIPLYTRDEKLTWMST